MDLLLQKGRAEYSEQTFASQLKTGKTEVECKLTAPYRGLEPWPSNTGTQTAWPELAGPELQLLDAALSASALCRYLFLLVAACGVFGVLFHAIFSLFLPDTVDTLRLLGK